MTYTFTSALKAIRTNEGLSISEIARRSNINRTQITGYLNGANPTFKNRQKLAEALLADHLLKAGYLTKICPECGTTFTHDPNDKKRIYCKRKCNIRATATRNQNYRTKYVTARFEHDLQYHMEAVAKFCDWCTASETVCPDKRCPLAKVSPLNYESYEDPPDEPQSLPEGPHLLRPESSRSKA